MTKLTDIALDHHVTTLRRDGYLILQDAAPAELIATLDRDLAPVFAETPFGTGSFYGETTKRFGRLLARSPAAAPLVQNARILAVVEAIRKPFADTIQLNVAQAIGVHPGAPAQMPHRDQKRGSHASAPLADGAKTSLESRNQDASGGKMLESQPFWREWPIRHNDQEGHAAAPPASIPNVRFLAHG